MEKTLKNMINQTTEQIKLFLNVDALASTAVADEIINENDIITKLSKFNRLVIDRLSFSQDPSKYNTSLILSLIKNTKQIIPNTPNSAKEFAEWLPEMLQYQRSEVKSLKKKLINCQKTLLQTQLIVDEFSKKSLNEKHELQEKIKALKKENKLMAERYADREDFIQYHKTQTSIADAKLQNSENIIRELRDENGKLKLALSDKEAIIRTVKAENMKVKETAKNAANQKEYDRIEKAELIYEIECLEKAMKQTMKVQKLPCGCFDDDVNWVKAHKDMHIALSTYQQENEELKQQVSFLENQLSKLARSGDCCKCKHSKTCLKSIRQKVDVIKADVEDLRNEVY